MIARKRARSVRDRRCWSRVPAQGRRRRSREVNDRHGREGRGCRAASRFVRDGVVSEQSSTFDRVPIGSFYFHQQRLQELLRGY
jgi:hypothetical protein